MERVTASVPVQWWYAIGVGALVGTLVGAGAVVVRHGHKADALGHTQLGEAVGAASAGTRAEARTEVATASDGAGAGRGGGELPSSLPPPESSQSLRNALLDFGGLAA